MNKECVIVFFGRPLDYSEVREVSLSHALGMNPYEGEEVRVAHNCIIYMPSLRYVEDGSPLLLSTTHLFVPEGARELLRDFCNVFDLFGMGRIGWYVHRVE